VSGGYHKATVHRKPLFGGDGMVKPISSKSVDQSHRPPASSAGEARRLRKPDLGRVEPPSSDRMSVEKPSSSSTYHYDLNSSGKYGAEYVKSGMEPPSGESHLSSVGMFAFFVFFPIRAAIAVATWLSVCLSVTLMYCAQKTESIIMRPSPDCSAAILVGNTMCISFRAACQPQQSFM